MKKTIKQDLVLAEKAYQELVDICKMIEQKRKLGWLLLGSRNELISDKIGFRSAIISGKCIGFKISKNGLAVIVRHNECSVYGKSTLISEYSEAKKHLLKLKMIEPKKIHKLDEL